jgi:plastocyanin
MSTLRQAISATTTLTMLLMAGCGGSDTPRLPPTSPTPPPSPPVTANAYILPDAVSRNDWAFGDEPVVIYKGERLRWVNGDTLTHVIVADSPDATDFRKTDELPSGGEQSFIMNTLGTTRIHCSVHPTMTGTLIVREH